MPSAAVRMIDLPSGFAHVCPGCPIPARARSAGAGNLEDGGRLTTAFAQFGFPPRRDLLNRHRGAHARRGKAGDHVRPLSPHAGAARTRVGDIDGNAARAVEAWEAGLAAGADLVALPEMFITGYNTQDLVLKPVFHQTAMPEIEPWPRMRRRPRACHRRPGAGGREAAQRLLHPLWRTHHGAHPETSPSQRDRLRRVRSTSPARSARAHIPWGGVRIGSPDLRGQLVRGRRRGARRDRGRDSCWCPTARPTTAKVSVRQT